VLGEFSGCDLIFLDIPSDALSGEEESSSWCARLFSLLKSVEVLVTLDARLQPTVLRRLLQSARTYGDASAVITRMDEGAPLGSVISILSALSVPISFLSTGKVVPVDIEPASVSRLAWWLSKSFLEGGVDVRRINQVVENRLNDGLVVGRESVASNTSLNVTPVLFSEFM
jgi:flagellar biosynthesis GTPase FlhF